MPQLLRTQLFALAVLIPALSPQGPIAAPLEVSARLVAAADGKEVSFRVSVRNATRDPLCFTHDNFDFGLAKFYDGSGFEIPNNFNSGYAVTIGMMVNLIVVPPDGQWHLHQVDASYEWIFGHGANVDHLSRVRFELFGYNYNDLMRNNSPPRIVFRQSLEENVASQFPDDE